MVPRSSPARGAPRCSPHANRAKSTSPAETHSKASRALVFQPQLLDSTTREDRSGLDFESQAKKSLIPSPLKQKRPQSQQHTGSSKAEHEDTASSAASAHSTVALDAIPSPKTVLGLETTPERQDAAFEHDQLDPTFADQALQGADVIVVVLSSGSKACCLSPEGCSPALKKLISSPAFLKTVRLGAGSPTTSGTSQPEKRSIYSLAALTTAIFGCAVVAVFLFQQQRALPWQGAVPV